MTKEGILSLHRVMLYALRLPFFSPAASDLIAWESFVSVLDSLGETPAGPLTPRDVRNVIDGMRRSNARGDSKWSLRLTNILRNPESFRDLVLESRRIKRERPESRPVAVVTALDRGDSIVIYDEDHRPEQEPVTMTEEARKFVAEFEARKARRLIAGGCSDVR